MNNQLLSFFIFAGLITYSIGIEAKIAWLRVSGLVITMVAMIAIIFWS